MATLSSFTPRQTYEPIISISLVSTATSITVSNIPSNYTDLFGTLTYANSTASYGLALQMNGDSSNNYSDILIRGSTSTTGSSRRTGVSYTYISQWGVTSSTTSPEAHVFFHIMNYSSSNTFKTILSGSSGNGSTNGTDRSVGLWSSLNAINSITFIAAPSGSLISGSKISIYGIKAAA